MHRTIGLCFIVVALFAGVWPTPSARAPTLPQDDPSGSAIRQVSGEGATSTVPHLVKFADSLKDQAGKPITGPVTLIFSFYELQEGGSPLWSETQAARADEEGHYAVLLGASQPDGVPVDLFASGRARWLGVEPQVPGMAELPRVLMVSTPYALKAADAETLGGKPASAFVTVDTAAATSGGNQPGAVAASASQGAHNGQSKTQSNGPMSSIGGSGNAGFIPIWKDSTDLGNSGISQSGSNIFMGNQLASESLQVWGPVAASTSSTNGIAVTGKSTANSSWGVEGTSAGINSTGVYGFSSGPSSTGVGGNTQWVSSGTPSAVYGYTTLGWGVRGVAAGSNSIGVYGNGKSYGVEGFSALGSGVLGLTTQGWGVIGNATGSGTGIVASNNTFNSATLFSYNSAGSGALSLFAGNPSATLGCSISYSGDFYCTGSKSAMVALDDGRKVALYAVESPENWFED